MKQYIQQNRLKIINFPKDLSSGNQITVGLTSQDTDLSKVMKNRDAYSKKCVFIGSGDNFQNAINDLSSNLGLEEMSAMAGGAIAMAPSQPRRDKKRK